MPSGRRFGVPKCLRGFFELSRCHKEIAKVDKGPDVVGREARDLSQASLRGVIIESQLLDRCLLFQKRHETACALLLFLGDLGPQHVERARRVERPQFFARGHKCCFDIGSVVRDRHRLLGLRENSFD